ncbi:MAG: PilZ domain-containing protein [Polyangiaceae bacterium]
MSEERRHAPRHTAYLGAELDLGDGPVRSAITHDGSSTGLLLLTRAELAADQEVTIRCFLGKGEPVMLKGIVVRQEALSPEENSLWRSKVAVKLEGDNPELAKHFEEIGERQAVTYGEKR